MKKTVEGPALEEVSVDAGIIKLRPLIVYEAETEDDAVRAVGLSKDDGLPLTPRGAGTSIPSQAVGSGAVLLQRRSAIVVSASQVECEPGVVKADLNSRLEGTGAWMPVDPSSYRSCTVGGMASNNSSGARTIKYGSTIDYVVGARVVLPEEGLKVFSPVPLETALSSGGLTSHLASLLLDNRTAIESEVPKVTKNSCGYRLERTIHDGVLDVPRLLVGSEGTLGVITEVTFRTAPKPHHRVLLVAESSLGELGPLTAAMRRHGPSAVELVDKSIFVRAGRGARLKRLSRTERQFLVYCELDSTSADGASERVGEVASDALVSRYEPVIMTDPASVSEAWDARSEILSVASEIRSGRKTPLPGVEDLIVPPDRFAELIAFVTGVFERRGLDFVTYGHAGDANLHMRPLLDPESTGDLRILTELMQECFEKVWEMGGSITGEHGDGMLRAAFVQSQYPKTFELMKEVKRLFDPRGMMNPGVKIV
ncbi:MAG TPA: FAD-binding oxidoreductase [Nitrososphaerales archaeon]|nr:FAD-binding oxidoreductase [Nitrososphaerales archaeon]